MIDGRAMSVQSEGSPSVVDDFLFSPVNPRAAAVFRTLLAAMVVWTFESAGLRAASPLGDLPGAEWLYAEVVLTGWYHAILFALCAWLALGWRPRMPCVLLLILLVPLLSLSRGQISRQVIWFTLAAFAFIQSDAAWSLRTLFSRDRSEPIAGDAGPIWPIRLIQLQLTLVYGVNAAVKMFPDYLTGDVLLALSAMRPNFNVDMADGIVTLGPLDLPVMVAAVATVITEAFLAIAFWCRRLRWFAAAVGICFHLCLMIVVDIWMLDWVSMFLYLAFLLHWRMRTPP